MGLSRSSSFDSTTSWGSSPSNVSIPAAIAPLSRAITIWHPQQLCITQLNDYRKAGDGWVSTAWRTLVCAYVILREICVFPYTYLKNRSLRKLEALDSKLLTTFYAFLKAERNFLRSDEDPVIALEKLQGSIKEWVQKTSEYINGKADLSTVEKEAAWNEKLRILKSTTFIPRTSMQDRLLPHTFPFLEGMIQASRFETLNQKLLTAFYTFRKVQRGLLASEEAICDSSITAVQESIKEWVKKTGEYISGRADLSTVEKVAAWNEKLRVLKSAAFISSTSVQDRLLPGEFTLLETRIRNDAFAELNKMALSDLKDGKIEDIGQVTEAIYLFVDIKATPEEIADFRAAFISNMKSTLTAMCSRENIASALLSHMGLQSETQEVRQLELDIQALQTEHERLTRLLGATSTREERASRAIERFSHESPETRARIRQTHHNLGQTAKKLLEQLESTQQKIDELSAAKAQKIQELKERASDYNIRQIYKDATRPLIIEYLAEERKIRTACARYLPNGRWISEEALTMFLDPEKLAIALEPKVKLDHRFVTFEEVMYAATHTEQHGSESSTVPTSSRHQTTTPIDITPYDEDAETTEMRIRLEALRQ